MVRDETGLASLPRGVFTPVAPQVPLYRNVRPSTLGA